MEEPQPEPESDHDVLGDLSDVEPEHIKEVVNVLRQLRATETEPGGVAELRAHFLTLQRICGFSREAALQLCSAMTRCLVARRSDDSSGTSRESVQRAFMRMGGLKQIVHVLLLRLSDPDVVCSCVRVLAAAVQGSPLAAEAMLYGESGDSNNIKLLLRAIERHGDHVQCAEHGCHLISHLCAAAPVAGAETAPPRARAHRDCQKKVAEEGALDLVVELFGKSLDEVEQKVRAVDKTTKPGSKPAFVPKASTTHMQKTVMKVKGQLEVRAGWARISELEASHARVQDAALQALLLVAFNNSATTRMLAGALWCLRSTKVTAVAQEFIVEAQAAAKEHEKEEALRRFKRGLGPVDRDLDSAPPTYNDGELVGEARQRLGTYEAFTKTVFTLADLLQGHTARDRPYLATKACRLLSLLAEYQLGVLGQVDEASGIWKNTQSHKLKSGLLEPRSTSMQQPLALLDRIVNALTHTLRTHEEDVPALAAALDALLRVRDVALRSAPAGMAPGGGEVRSAWQTLLSQAEEKGELRQAERTLATALKLTDGGNRRMQSLGLQANTFTGDGACFLTPRMRGVAEKSMNAAAELAADTLAVAWQKGDTGRVKGAATTKQLKETRGARNSSPARKQSKDSRTPSRGAKPQRRPQVKRSASTKNFGDQGGDMTFTSPDDGTRQRPRYVASASAMGAGFSPTSLASRSGPAEASKQPEYSRALGYGTHDEQDFDRVWRKPLTDVLTRSFSQPAPRSPAPQESPLRDVLDELQVELVQSAPGKLKARVIVNPDDRVHQTVADHRLQELLDTGAAARILGNELTKTMRRSGVMMPKYGMQVSVRRGRMSSAMAGSILVPQAIDAARLPGGR